MPELPASLFAVPQAGSSSGDTNSPAPFPDETQSARLTLPWLLLLRWLAVIGQIVTVFVVHYGVGIRLPMPELLVLISFTALTNLALLAWQSRARQIRPWHIWGILAGDAVLLTGMLHLTGGPLNPFLELYLVHVALAAITLSPRLIWLMVLVCGFCYLTLFFWARPLEFPAGYAGPDLEELRRFGLVISFGIASALIAYFVGKLASEVRRSQLVRAEARVLKERHERLSAIATLAAGVAHEMGSPLGTIAIASHELQRAAERSEPHDEEILEDARLIREQTIRCRKILDKLNYGATQEAWRHRDTFELSALLEGLQEALPVDHWNRLCISREVVEPGQKIHAPLERLIEATEVLVENAIQASPAGLPVHLRLLHHGGEVSISVEDQGTGMNPVTRSRAADPFFTTKEPGQGMGLGLFLVRTLAERLNGRLLIESELEKGTKVTLSFPEPENSG